MFNERLHIAQKTALDSRNISTKNREMNDRHKKSLQQDLKCHARKMFIFHASSHSFIIFFSFLFDLKGILIVKYKTKDDSRFIEGI